MGIVDYGRYSRRRANGFETAPHRAQGAQGAQRLLLVGPEQPRRAVYGQQVAGVEAAEEIHPHLAAVHAQQHAVEKHLDDLAIEVGRRAQRVTARAGSGVLRHNLAVAVVGVHQSESLLGQRVEEAFLGLDILREGLVIVQMVVGYVGEYGSLELQPSDALLHDRVRRHLHEAVFASRVDHLAQHGIEPHGVGRGVRRLRFAVPHAVDHRGDQPRAIAQRAEQIAQQRGHGGLAVGARHAHQPQLARRVVVKGGGHVGHRAVAVVDDHVANALFLLGGQLLAHHGRHARPHGVGDEVVAVALRAPHGEEAVARARFARVVMQAHDLGVGRGDYGARGRGREQFAESFHFYFKFSVLSLWQFAAAPTRRTATRYALACVPRRRRTAIAYAPTSTSLSHAVPRVSCAPRGCSANAPSLCP